MRTGTTRIFVVALAVTLAAMMIARDRSEVRRLQDRVDWLQSQLDQSASAGTENKGISQPVQEERKPTESVSETSPEILRLRGEVGRLHLELAEAQAEVKVNSGNLHEQQPVVHDLFAPELDPVSNISVGTSATAVLAELQTAGAQLLAQEQGLIQAGISLPTASGDHESVLVEFYFEGDRLSSKKVTILP